MADRQSGTVAWFNDDRGYGFIERDGDLEDVFVHYSNVNMDGYVTLEEGQDVEFDLEPQEDGPAAVDVDVLEATPFEEPTETVGGTR